jgi:hypothetical protein
VSTFDLIAPLRSLKQHDVQFVLIGGLAAAVWGSSLVTFDVDVCYERSMANCERLAAALREMQATLRGAPAGLPFQLDARTIRAGDSFTFETTYGAFDCLGTPSGTSGYADLLRNSAVFEVADDLSVHVASIDDLLRMKRAAGRVKDRSAIEILEAIKQERELQP